MHFLALLLFCCLGISPSIYESIPDPKHPRMCDWVQIQEFLRRGPREELQQMEQSIDAGIKLYDYGRRARRFRLIGKHFWERPQFGIVPIGCSLEEKERCVITYASFNQRYPEAVKLLQKQLEKVGFRGHFVYRIGGWPDLEGGSLKLVHVPYAFKPCFFREVRKLGYRNVLWLDSSIRPLRFLAEAFETIERQGYLLYATGHALAPVCTRQVMESFGLTENDARRIQSVAAGLVGLSFAHPKGIRALDMWMEAASNGKSFFSPRSDQNALSIIAELLEMKSWEDGRTLSWSEEAKGEEVRFWIDYKSVQSSR